MRKILNLTRSSRDRYTLQSGSQGGYGDGPNHANNNLEVVNGVDKGNGYQGCMSVSYALSEEAAGYMPPEAIASLMAELERMGYDLKTLTKPATLS